MKITTAITLSAATILSSHESTAFTAPRAHQLIAPSKGFSTLRSTLVDETDTINKQQLTEEQTQENYITETVANTQKSFQDDGFVFGLEGSGLERVKGRGANVVVEGDSLETTPQQVAMVSGTFAGQALIAANAIHELYTHTNGNAPVTALISLATIVSSWVAADLGSGILHWSVDNYGNGRTPVMGNIIAAFQGHHSAPWTITYRGFCNNVWKLCIPFGLPTVAAISFVAGPENPMVSLFFSFFCFSEIMSQELHKWSHMTKKETPAIVNTLQGLGITIGRVPHAQHHMAPYDGNYCIVSGFCNEALDNSGFFRWMEHRIYEINGVESNAMKLDPELRAKTLRGEYRLTQ
eukprot:CAMPEP_0113399808 /NCGR_PEP_ID=MMETSP0013_2-20120614/15755_1 /TAXON_ID=2843 ORGANISM="Skeletonema costatum, Strain 1716" /NCGR_SAMPLE_ID=MMETSP0013_2 /ASSEMBLY_ACC=CAM_ASM_000158 /LENGTH=350 /DNA_ID=CAMNT_0000284771 /DNA_START=97 /DNA_END=1149 /DNA_ORIENTATION=+ /assembly_acc=CAM_ASM_000158